MATERTTEEILSAFDALDQAAQRILTATPEQMTESAVRLQDKRLAARAVFQRAFSGGPLLAASQTRETDVSGLVERLQAKVKIAAFRGNRLVDVPVSDLREAASALSGQGWRSIPILPETVDYVSRYGGRCRDCADMVGVCASGLPCDPEERKRAISHVLSAVNYGFANGYLPLPAPPGERT